MKANNSQNTNAHTTSESWLRAATNDLRPYFDKLGYTLPEKIRFSISFTSTGKRGTIPGECWHPESSEDGYYRIYLRSDTSDPVEILGILVHELVHALLPSSVKHGKEYRKIALHIGLEGEMRNARPNPILRDRLQAIATNLGALPNAKLNYGAISDLPKKQKNRHRKAECLSCGYEGHNLEAYLVRLLFCLFAEDTSIFERRQFQDLIEQRTAEDGQDLAQWLDNLFQVLDAPENKRLQTLDEQLKAFPYVNGNLFAERLCGRRIFMRSAGMIHSARSILNSSHVASINSLVRTKVSINNCMALRVCG